MIGRKLGKYLIEAELGRGGMGVVYRAHQTSLDRTVAIKLLGQSLIGDPDGIRRFQQEAKAIARLNHGGIVQVYDIEEEGDFLYLVMEFVDGEALDALLSRMVLPEGRIVRIVADVADALHFAHEKGVIHRDVKPANVLMTRDGRPKVADFGLAYLIDREGGGPTKTGFLVGSPSYMSPEQAMGKKVDRRSDVYALGVVLFRMLTGRVPFIAESSHAILFKQVQEAPPDPLELNRDISLSVRNVVLRALAKNPDERFPTMAAFRDALLVCAGERPATAEAVLATEGLSPTGEAIRHDEPTPPSVGRAISGVRTPIPGPLTADQEPTAATAMMSAARRSAVVPAPVAPAPAPVAVPPAPAARPGLPAAALAGIGVAAVAILAVGGYALFRSGVLGTKAVPTPVPATPPPAAATAVPTLPAVTLPAPTVPPGPEAVPQAGPAPLDIAVAPVKTPKAARPTPVVVAQLPPTPAAGGAGESKTFCVYFGKVQFEQGKATGFAPGFSVDSGPAERAARPDAGKIAIVFEIDPPEPVLGEYFQLKASLANNGIADVKLGGVEENLPGSMTSFKRFTGFPYPQAVRVGMQEPVYAYQAEKLEGAFVKTIRVIDKNGDSWARTVEIRPCQ